MFGCRFSLFCVVAIILCICFFVGSSPTKKCPETERQALLRLKDGFIHGREVLSSWGGVDCCNWKGISCDNLTGRVISLDLQSSYYIYTLQGKLDSSICELQHLTSLNVNDNNLDGKIPKCIGNLSNLQTLQIGENNLVANDLEWVSNLANLRYLDMSYVNLSQAVGWLSSISKIIPSLWQLSLPGCGLLQVNFESTPLLNYTTSLKELDLSYNKLNSSTLLSVLNVGKFLTHLDFSSNELEGSLPESFMSLCQLKVLHLSFNKLSGQLSDNMKQLRCSQHGLELLDLSSNPFNSGPLLDFSGYSSLRILHLRNTNIVGPLFQVTKFALLEELDISENQLNESLPIAIGQLSNLTTLSLFSNKLSGVITEAHLSNLSRLTHMEVSQNSLSFNLSSNWVLPFQLKSFYASSCILGPKFPTWLKHQKGLVDLDMSNSGIIDSVPEWFWDMISGVESLNVSHNQIIGSLPRNLTGTLLGPIDSVFDFSFNNLSGPLPLFPELLKSLFLSHNKFYGSLSSFCASPPQRLRYLDLSSNLLASSLSNCWGKFKKLIFLNLARNKLVGRIPNSFGSLQQMVSLYLCNNNFSGEIPSFALSTSLKILDLGNNNLQGKLPAWVGHHLPRLIVLSLRKNKFQGKIPESLCNLSLLQVLDLSLNNITGEIPQCFSHITALTNIQSPRFLISYGQFKSLGGYIAYNSFYEIAILSWKGENREYGKSIALMTTIDLSCNHLTGGIPQSITKLVALAGLNLTRNNLTGFIPNNIGQMEILESLDLSRNHLCGRMPASFSNLSFLSYMNLSFNKLSGEIPIGTQLQSFNVSSYIENNGLCGPPVTNQCPGDVMPPTGIPEKHVTNENEDEDEDEDKLITFGFYICLCLGFCVGFWGVCGTLIIKASWRHAYFQSFNNMHDWIHMTMCILTVRMKKRFHVKPNKSSFM